MVESVTSAPTYRIRPSPRGKVRTGLVPSAHRLPRTAERRNHEPPAMHRTWTPSSLIRLPRVSTFPRFHPCSNAQQHHSCCCTIASSPLFVLDNIQYPTLAISCTNTYLFNLSSPPSSQGESRHLHTPRSRRGIPRHLLRSSLQSSQHHTSSIYPHSSSCYSLSSWPTVHAAAGLPLSASLTTSPEMSATIRTVL